jgi:Fur family transcriptional regulator, ferric uptake regulator
MSVDVVQLLKEKGLHITDARQKVLAAFCNKQTSLTQKDIQQFAGKALDRVTVYRTLEAFVKKGILHVIPSLDHVMRYALKKGKTDENCYDCHPHFFCEDCGKIICLDTVPLPAMHLPAGFAGKETDVLVKGTCNNCRKE